MLQKAVINSHLTLYYQCHIQAEAPSIFLQLDKKKDLSLLAVIPSTFTTLPSTRSLYWASESVTPLISVGMFTRSARKTMISFVCGSMETQAEKGSPFLGVTSMVLPRLSVVRSYPSLQERTCNPYRDSQVMTLYA